MKKLTPFVILMLLISPSVWAAAKKPKCLTNSEVACMLKANAANWEKYKVQFLANGGNLDEDFSIDLAIKDALTRSAKYAALPPNEQAAGCILNNQGDGSKAPIC